MAACRKHVSSKCRYVRQLLTDTACWNGRQLKWKPVDTDSDRCVLLPFWVYSLIRNALMLVACALGLACYCQAYQVWPIKCVFFLIIPWVSVAVVGWVMRDELKGIWKEAVVAHLRSRRLPGSTHINRCRAEVRTGCIPPPEYYKRGWLIIHA